MGQLKRVLYVDDDPDIREIATLAIRDVGGMEVLVCDSGKVALESIDKFDPQLILLDVMMPEMDGPSTLRALRAQKLITDSTAVVFLTAKIQAEALSDYQKLGVNDVISKPFDPMMLAEKLQEIWSRLDDR
ncbi:MAG: response regulator [Methylophaga sp.]|nr:response regulator [Methylophaga sp.]